VGSSLSVRGRKGEAMKRFVAALAGFVFALPTEKVLIGQISIH
jgi:hypothetical protein